MADLDHVAMLAKGVASWNAWRAANPVLRPDLSDFDFTSLKPVYTYDSDERAIPKHLWGINLKEADLRRTKMSGQYLQQADLSFSDLREAVLNDAVFKKSNLSHANLRSANLKGVRLILSDLSFADLSGAAIFGISPWSVNLTGARQEDLVITRPSDPKITVDNLEVAQFVYSLLDNKNIRGIFDTVTCKVVLILGRFRPERKAALEALRDKLRHKNYVPVLFDFDKPSKQSTMETIAVLARLAKFIIADLTAAKSVLQELQAIVPNVPSVPVQPLILSGEQEPGMLDYFQRFPWFLKVFIYQDDKELIKALPQVIAPAEELSEQLLK